MKYDFTSIMDRRGMDAMAITDHGAMFGAIDFYKACNRLSFLLCNFPYFPVPFFFLPVFHCI